MPGGPPIIHLPLRVCVDQLHFLLQPMRGDHRAPCAESPVHSLNIYVEHAWKMAKLNKITLCVCVGVQYMLRHVETCWNCPLDLQSSCHGVEICWEEIPLAAVGSMLAYWQLEAGLFSTVESRKSRASCLEGSRHNGAMVANELAA